MSHRSIALGAALLLALAPLGALPRAHADPSLECLAGLDAATLERLAARADAELAASQRRARAWLFSWLAVNVAFLIGSTVYAAVEDSHLQRDAGIWSAAGSGATAGLLFAPPLTTAFASRRLARLGGEERADPASRLARTVALLERGERQERDCRAPFIHVANASFSLAEGLYLGLRYEDSLVTALANGFGTFLISETQLVSSPRRAGRALERLRADGYTCAVHAANARDTPRAYVETVGFGVRVRF